MQDKEAEKEVTRRGPTTRKGPATDMADNENVTRKVGNAAGNRGKGRKKGVPNKTTAAFKEAVEFAAQGLGGADRLIAWAKEEPKNEAAFWTTIYPKLAPLQVNHQGSVYVSIGGRAADL